MKTKLILSTVVAAMLLTPAAFANGVQEQKPETADDTTGATVTVFLVSAQTEAAAVSRSVLARMQQEVREQVLGNLRNSGILAEVLQIAAPALVEATTNQKSVTAL